MKNIYSIIFFIVLVQLASSIKLNLNLHRHHTTNSTQSDTTSTNSTQSATNYTNSTTSLIKTDSSPSSSAFLELKANQLNDSPSSNNSNANKSCQHSYLRRSQNAGKKIQEAVEELVDSLKTIVAYSASQQTGASDNTTTDSTSQGSNSASQQTGASDNTKTDSTSQGSNSASQQTGASDNTNTDSTSQGSNTGNSGMSNQQLIQLKQNQDTIITPQNDETNSSTQQDSTSNTIKVDESNTAPQNNTITDNTNTTSSNSTNNNTQQDNTNTQQNILIPQSKKLQLKHLLQK